MYLPRVSHFLVLVTLPLSRALTGDYVCQRMENYTVTSKELVTVPVEKYTVDWCFSVTFRCPRTTTVMRKQFQIKSETRTRIVDECCEGYVRQEVSDGDDVETICVPACEQCIFGSCVAPGRCLCNVGYVGLDCSIECPEGTWGKDCMQKCSCGIGGICSKVDGGCECLPGWRGGKCEEMCPSGWWGQGCKSLCLCEGLIMTRCNPVTGKCSELEKQTLAGNWPMLELFRPSSVSVIDLPMHSSTLTNTNEPRSIAMSQPTRLSTTNQESVAHTEIAEADKFDVGGMSYETSTAGAQVGGANKGQKARNHNEGAETSNTEDINETLLPRVILPPESDFVENVQKDDVSKPVPIPVDVAVLIVIGAIISLSLTSVAALLIFCLRSRLVKAVRMSLYNGQKPNSENFEENFPPKETVPNTCTLSRTSPRANSVLLSNPEPKASLALDHAANEYANTTVTIDIRNLRELLEGHYDRPTSSYQRNDNDEHVEHVYDEIPLSTTFCVSKNAYLTSPFAPSCHSPVRIMERCTY